LNLLGILKIQWFFLGLTAPAFAWVFAGLLLAFPMLSLLWLFFVRFIPKLLKCSKAIKKITSIASNVSLKPADGIPIEVYDSLNQVFEKTRFIRSLLPCWVMFRS